MIFIMWYIKPDKQLAEQVLFYGQDILRSPNMQKERNFMQHGTTDCFTHSICVAYMALRIAQVLHIKNINKKSLVRGCLLHDFFLYDWHDKASACKFHTFMHPIISLKNAEKEFVLNNIERDIIRKHMFPLCFPFPKYKESFIITIADKCCAISEIWHVYSLEKIIHLLEGRIQHEILESDFDMQPVYA